MINHKYTSDNIDTILTKQEVVKSILHKWTTNHSDYSYNLEVVKEDNKYCLKAKLTR